MKLQVFCGAVLVVQPFWTSLMAATAAIASAQASFAKNLANSHACFRVPGFC